MLLFEDVPVQAISLEVKTVTERGDLRDELGSEFDDTCAVETWLHIVVCSSLWGSVCRDLYLSQDRL